jgi:hypothetical protein
MNERARKSAGQSLTPPTLYRNLWILCIVVVLVAFEAIFLVATFFDEPPGWTQAAILIPIGVAGGAGFYFRDEYRRTQMEQSASLLGLRYEAKDSSELANFPFPLFEQRRGRVANLLVGTWQGLDVAMFDYEWEEYTDRGCVTRHKSCAVTTIPASFPPLSIRPKGFFSRTTRRLGPHNVEVGWEPFDRAYKVECGDEQFANELLDPRMHQWLLSIGKEWSFETSGAGVLCGTDERRPPEELELVRGHLEGFRDRIPRSLLEAHPPMVPDEDAPASAPAMPPSIPPPWAVAPSPRRGSIEVIRKHWPEAVVVVMFIVQPPLLILWRHGHG